MARMNLRTMKFAKVYPFYVRKAERKNRTKHEVDAIIRWLTNYDQSGIEAAILNEADFETFFAQAPALHPNARLITGTICGYRIEDIIDPVEQQVRWLDKLIDELAKGRPMERILRK
jgi:hypothetical protein